MADTLAQTFQKFAQDRTPQASASAPNPEPTKAPEPAAAAPPTSAPAPVTTPPATPWKFKVKVDREEREIDAEAELKDEQRREAFRIAYQKGLAHDSVVERERRKAYGDFFEALSQQGYEWEQDASAPGGVRFKPKAAPAAATQAASPADDDADLRDGLDKGDVNAVLTAAERRFKRELERRETEAKKAREQEEQKTQAQRRYESIRQSAIDAIEAQKAFFDGIPDERANPIRSRIYSSIVQEAVSGRYPAEEIPSRVKAAIEDLGGFVSARIPKKEPPPAPPAAPVLGGGAPVATTTTPTTPPRDVKEAFARYRAERGV